MSSEPRFAPSSRNCTLATPTLSEAVALTVTAVPPTTALAAGAVIVTVGAIVSVPAVTVSENVVVWTTAPEAPVTVMVDVASGVALVVAILIVLEQGGVHDPGLKFAVAPAGNPAAVNVSGAGTPESRDAVIRLEAVALRTTETLPPLPRAKVKAAAEVTAVAVPEAADS